MKPINRFEAIKIPNASSAAFSIDITSNFEKPNIELLEDSLYYSEYYSHSSSLEIHPDPEWPSGSNITVTVDNIPREYFVVENIYLYAPVSFLYSSNLLAEPNLLETLKNNGLASNQEVEFIEAVIANAPKLLDLYLEIGKVFLPRFAYNNTPLLKEVQALKLFRLFIKFLYMLGLESLVTYYALDVGPTKDWYINSHIDGLRSEEQIRNRIDGAQLQIKKLVNIMHTRELNIDILKTLPQHIDSSLVQHKMLDIVVTLLIALRLAANGQFKY